MTPSKNTFAALRKEDSLRVKFAAKKILEQVQMRRRKLRALKKTKRDKQSKANYKTGSFGLSDKPEDLTIKIPTRKRKRHMVNEI